MLDASIAWKMSNGVTVSAYGRNLLNEVTEGIVSPLPATWGGPGATQAPLNKCRVLGLSARYAYEDARGRPVRPQGFTDLP